MGDEDAKLKIQQPGVVSAGPKPGAPAKAPPGGGLAPRPQGGGLTPNFSPPANPPKAGAGAAVGMMRPQMGGMQPAAGAKTGMCSANCKWCLKGECWTSGQISKGKGM